MPFLLVIIAKLKMISAKENLNKQYDVLMATKISFRSFLPKRVNELWNYFLTWKNSKFPWKTSIEPLTIEDIPRQIENICETINKFTPKSGRVKHEYQSASRNYKSPSAKWSYILIMDQEIHVSLCHQNRFGVFFVRTCESFCIFSQIVGGYLLS